MLVLSRKVGEKIYINDSIAVTVVRLDGNRVSLGFEAPDNVRIMRSELRRIVNVCGDCEQAHDAPALVGAGL